MKAAMPAELRVKDVMTEAVVFLRTHHTLEEAWNALHAHSIQGAPVLDDRGRLVGVLSRSNLADPRTRPPLGPGTVESAMTRVVYAVRAEDPVMSAVRLMILEHIHRALVVRDDGSIAGIVVAMDILRALATGKLPQIADGGEHVQFVDLASFKPKA